MRIMDIATTTDLITQIQGGDPSSLLHPGRPRFAWANGNRMIICPPNEPLTQSGTDPSFTQNGNGASKKYPLYDVRWHVALHNPITKKLACESHGIFLSLQKHASENKDIKSNLIKYSRKYRSVLGVCILNLRGLDGMQDEECRKQYEMQLEMFYDIELIMSLCEILFLDIQPAGLVLNQLLNWIRWHFTEPDNNVIEIINSEEPEKHKSYWPVVYQFTLQGRLQDARRVLKLHPLSDRDDFQSMDELLRKMPFYIHYSDLPLPEFSLRWHHWQDECKQRLQDGDFSLSQELETLCQILSGDISVFEKISDYCQTWYHLLVSRLLFTDPCTKSHMLHVLAKECIEMFGGLSELSHVDHILYSAMELDLHQVIKHSCYFNDNWWFVAHLTDLLYHSGQLELMELGHSIQMRESFLLEYAASLMSHDTLWQIGVGYFAHCPYQGRYHLEQYLQCTPLTEYTAQKVLNVAFQYNMKDVVRSVCKVMGLHSLRNKRPGNALIWAMKSNDAPFASYVAEKFLLDYSTTGQFSNMDLLVNLGSCMLVSDKLTFLGKYCEFHMLYKDKELKEAGDLLISLLESRLAPKHFRVTLLLDALPLLEAEELIFSSQQTCQLMQCLEELVILEDKGHVLTRLKENESLLRLALARNLSRAFLDEGSVTQK